MWQVQKNAEKCDFERDRYIDFGAGIVVSNTDDSHSEIIAAVKRKLINLATPVLW